MLQLNGIFLIFRKASFGAVERTLNLLLDFIPINE
jgi:hypothetical protein